MNPALRKALILILTLVFLGSAAKIIYQTMEYRQGDAIYAEAEVLAGLPDLSGLPAPSLPSGTGSGSSPSASGQVDSGEPRPVYVDPYADALRNMDFSALREVNQDVLGWILIPGTHVSYPVVQGTDNRYYLNHTWRNSRNSVGAIFLEHSNSRDLSDFNTIIYGHRMNNRSMFGTLHEYKNADYWAAHPYVYLTDQNGSGQYEIFAAYEVSTDGDTYLLGFSGDQAKQNFLDSCLAQSLIHTGVVPSVHDRILTLSTCTGNGHATRWVVQAVLRGAAPSDSAGQTPQETPSAGGDASTPSSAPPDSSGSGSADAPGDASEQGPISQDIRPDDRAEGPGAAADASIASGPGDSSGIDGRETVPASP